MADSCKGCRMNELIQALAVKAEDYADSVVDAGGEFHPAYTKKFAELIVRECCDILTDNVEVALNASGSPVYPEGLIREHFGVEE